MIRETKRQSKGWNRLGEKHIKKERVSKCKIKNLVIAFFDIRGITPKHWVPRGQTINAVYYIKVLKQLWRAIAAKIPELWKANNWLLHNHNAPAHHSVKTWKFLAYHQTTILKRPTYSLDFTQNDFFLYLKIKEMLQGAHFASEVMKKAC